MAASARLRFGSLALAAALPALLVPDTGSAARARTHEKVGSQLFESPQADPIVLNAAGTRLYVANTTSNTVSVIDTAGPTLLALVEVGVEPVSLALRPVANELWVSNHVSDTVSVVDVAPGSPTENRVVDTLQELDADGVTGFDEPVGIAFTTDGAKGFVALSSRDQIAVIDAAARTVTSRIKVRGQDPRAIAVRGSLLYVAAFEGGNQTETGACPTENNNNAQCTLGLADLATFAVNPNLPGEQKNIVVDTANPDRDLFVYRTDTHAEVAAVSGVGTLLYGIAVSSGGRAFVTQTDARNAANGIVAPAAARQDVNGDGFVNLRDLANRMFTNEIAATTCTLGGCGAVTITDLEPGATQLATPYGIAISGDDQTLVATAMGSSRVFTVDANTMAILDTLDLGSVGAGNFGQQMPRGVALRSDGGGAPLTAYVLNSFENTVSVIDVSNPSAIDEDLRFGVGNDPTPPEVRRGRIAFNNAFASSGGTFSCGSCHPDGHTDQLLWRIGGECFLSGCVAGEDEPRSTMPVRGLKNTVPLHWDGTLGDPFGGGNGQVGNGGTPIDPSQACNINDADGDHDCFRDLVNASLSGVMCDQTPSCANGPSGLPGPLTDAEREDMAFFLASVSVPPARSRRVDDTLSTPADPVPVPNGDGTPSATLADALTGFQDFFTNQGGLAGDPDTCADSTAGCHALPLGGGTNSSTLAGFDIPSMRGMTDRVLQFSLGITNPRDILLQANAGSGFPPANPLEAPIQFSTTQGYREITTFGSAFLIFQPVYGTRPLNSFQMFEEASTGYSGAQARQVQLNTRTTGGGLAAQTDAVMTALELADARGLVNLRAVGVRDAGSGLAPITLSYRPADGTYKNGNDSVSLTHAQLVAEAQAGDAILTLTAALRARFGTTDGPQPLLGACVAGCSTTTGDPALPNFATGGASDPPAFSVVGTDVRTDAAIFVDGAPVTGTLSCGAGSTGSFCNDGNVSIDLAAKPAAGLHLVQVLNPQGPVSNELPLCVGTSTNCN
jgi:YVTN family beta-propeller protein